MQGRMEGEGGGGREGWRKDGGEENSVKFISNSSG